MSPMSPMSPMSIDWSQSRIHCPLDLTGPGKRAGALQLPHSDNANPLGFYPIPMMAVVGAPGPTTLLTGGVHGDEFEGPVALLDLYRQLDPSALKGRLLILPALNAPALRAAARVSPLDGGNLNRAFPGDPSGPPTAMIAHLVESLLMPQCEAAIDLHSGGKAAFFAPSALAARAADGALDPENMALAEAFGAPVIWVLGRHNEDRSVNAAATRQGVRMIATELGGRGTVTPDILALAKRGLRRCLARLGHIEEALEPLPAPLRVEIGAADHKVYCPSAGLYEPVVEAGVPVSEGDLLARLHSLEAPDEAPRELRAPTDGLLLAVASRGIVAQGDFAGLVAQELSERA